MTGKSEALSGLLSTMREFVQDVVDKTFPASAITFEALRHAQPELAKTIFVEAIIAPAKNALRDYADQEAYRLLDEMESQVLQVSVTNLYYDVEVIVASRLLEEIFNRSAPALERFHMEPAHDENGDLTATGWWLSKDIARDVAEVLARLAAVRESRVQLLLAAALVGKESFDQAVQTHTAYHRGALLQSVDGWLMIQNIGAKKRKKLMEQLDKKAPDEYIASFQDELTGKAFLGEAQIQIIAHELLGGEEHIEF